MFKNIEWIQFIQAIEKCEYIACLGSGGRLKTFEKLFDENILKKVRYLADNSPQKQGTEIEFAGRKMIICSLPFLKSRLNSKVVVIITPIIFNEILEQIKIYKEFDETTVFSLTHILDSYKDYEVMKKHVPDNLRLSDKMLIPKKIHYCWFGRNPLPERYKKWMSSWRKYCSDYEIIEWNEDNYDITKNKYMKQAYEAKKWGFVADYAKLDIIYNYGGIHFDTDVEIVKNFDELLYQEGFAGFESEKYVALGLGFGARAGNKFVKGMLEAYGSYSFINQSGNINLTTAPILQTEYLMTCGLKQNGEYQILDGSFAIYPEKVLNGRGCPPKNVKLASYTYSVHHYDGSWLDEDVRQREKNNRKEKGIAN